MSTQPFGLIDIGSNSIVLLVAQPEGRAWQVLERRKATARLGAAIDEHGSLTSDGIERLEQVLVEFVECATSAQASVRIAATASLRNVANGTAVATMLSQRLGHQLRILSEREEALYAFRGVWAAEGRIETPMVVVDVGGGSAEIAWGRAGRLDGFFSVPVGAVRLSMLQGGADPIEPHHVQSMRERVSNELEPVQAQLPEASVVFGCSGSIRRLCHLVKRTRRQLTCDELNSVVLRLEEAAWRQERLALPGMDPARVDVLLPAALIHQHLAQRFAWQAYQLSSGGLRWGLLDALVSD